MSLQTSIRKPFANVQQVSLAELQSSLARHRATEEQLPLRSQAKGLALSVAISIQKCGLVGMKRQKPPRTRRLLVEEAKPSSKKQM